MEGKSVSEVFNKVWEYLRFLKDFCGGKYWVLFVFIGDDVYLRW